MRRKRVRRNGASAVAGMHACFLDMLHNASDAHFIAITQSIDIALGCITQVTVDQNGALARYIHCRFNVVVKLSLAIDNLHRAAAQDV